jgi:lysyl-tRNA synthetase class 2
VPKARQTEWQPAAHLQGLQRRAQVLRQIREFFYAREVLEVQTAALATTSVTEPNIDSIVVPHYGFLQTSPEYQMKRLLAAGAPSIYQLGPAFRHGEAGRLHNPEFTLLEWYRLGFDEVQLMAEVAELVDAVLGVQSFSYLTYAELLDVEPGSLDPDQQDLLLLQRLDELLEQGQRRVFITHYPASQAALARMHPKVHPKVHPKAHPLDESLAARFELVVDGVELANGYHELTDAKELRQRFQRDQALRHSKGKPAMDIDEQLLAALEAGLPNCAGVALGVDRLVMQALGASSLHAGMAFPHGFV